MTSRATDVVLDLLHYTDPRVRRNALTALGALDSPDGLDAIVQAALEDEDLSVRRRAEEELTEEMASPAGLARVREAVERRMTGDGWSKPYSLLGRLRVRSLPNVPVRRRLIWSFRATPELAQGRHLAWAVGWSVLGYLVVGCAFALALMLAARSFDDSTELFAMV